MSLLEDQLFKTDPPPSEAQIKLIIDQLRLAYLLDYKDRDGNTPLMRAVMTRNLSITQALMRAAADLTIRNKEGLTPLMLAVKNQNTELVTLLSSENAQRYNQYFGWDGWSDFIDMSSKIEGNTPLMFAVETGNLDVVNALLLPNHAGNGNFQNKEGNTALMLAAKGGDLAILKRVCRSQDVNLKNKKGMTALSIALESPDKSDNLIFLISQGADITPHLVACKDLIMPSVDLCLSEGRNDQARAILKHSIMYYPDLAQSAIYRLVENTYKTEKLLDFGFQEGKKIPTCVSYALELDSSKLDASQKAFKEKILKEYWFSDKLDDKLFASSMLPIIEQSHSNPVLAYAAITKYRNDFPADQLKQKQEGPKKLTDAQEVLMQEALPMPSGPNWFQRIWGKLFTSPSDLEKLNTEFSKKPNKQKQDVIVSIIRRILLKGGELPAGNPEIMIAALETIKKERPMQIQPKHIRWSSYNGQMTIGYNFKDLANESHSGYMIMPDAQHGREDAAVEAFALQQGWPLNNEALLLKAHETLGRYYLEEFSNVNFISAPQTLASAIVRLEKSPSHLITDNQLPPPSYAHESPNAVASDLGSILEPSAPPYTPSLPLTEAPPLPTPPPIPKTLPQALQGLSEEDEIKSGSRPQKKG